MKNSFNNTTYAKRNATGARNKKRSLIFFWEDQQGFTSCAALR
jgi:hypothetical protein